MFEKMRPAVCVLLIVMLFVFITEHGETHNYQNHKYLYVVASASAGINGYGEDPFGDYTEYWVYAGASLSTPSDIEGDANYRGTCYQIISAPGFPTWIKNIPFFGSSFITKSYSGNFRYYTAFDNKSNAFALQDSDATYTVNGQNRSVSHDHGARVKVPPGGSQTNGPY